MAPNDPTDTIAFAIQCKISKRELRALLNNHTPDAEAMSAAAKLVEQLRLAGYRLSRMAR